MKKAGILVISAFLFSCVHVLPTQGEKEPKLRLSVKETTVEGYDVHLRVVITGAYPRTPKYYCLDQLWEFGNGHSMLFEDTCAPYEKMGTGWTPRRGFHRFYKYAEPGKYKVRFSLVQDGRTVLRSNKVTVKIKKK